MGDPSARVFEVFLIVSQPVSRRRDESLLGGLRGGPHVGKTKSHTHQQEETMLSPRREMLIINLERDKECFATHFLKLTTKETVVAHTFYSISSGTQSALNHGADATINETTRAYLLHDSHGGVLMSDIPGNSGSQLSAGPPLWLFSASRGLGLVSNWVRIPEEGAFLWLLSNPIHKWKAKRPTVQW